MRARDLLAFAVAAPFVLTACGAAAEDAHEQAFCAEVPDLLEGVTMNMSIANTVGGDQAIDILSNQVDKLQAVKPPEDVADEWGALVDSWTSFRDLLADAVAHPPDDLDAFESESQPYQQRLTDTGAAVDAWAVANCDPSLWETR